MPHAGGQTRAGHPLYPTTVTRVSGELTFPILPCRDLDESIAFYELLGFERTYRQLRPNPYGVVVLEDLQIHLAGIEGFVPEHSYGSAIVVVPDADALYASFARRLRDALGKLPSAGIPRILRPRKRHGTVRGFSVVDPGGNWLRISTLGDTEADARDTSTGLARVIDNAARQADARGDDEFARTLLTNGLARFTDAPPSTKVLALAYLTELNIRVGDLAAARTALDDARSVPIDTADQPQVDDALDHAITLFDEANGT